MSNILYIACFAVLFAEVSGLMQYVKYKLRLSRLRPLDCSKCLAWWLAIILLSNDLKTNEVQSWVIYLGTSAICSLLGHTLEAVYILLKRL